METTPGPGAVCSTCGKPLAADGDCLACLLREGMEETAAEPPSSASSPLSSSTVYGDFEIARREDGSLWELGRGAMGVTYRAVDRVLHRAVALKVIQLGAASASGGRASEAIRERFLREARAAAALRHTNVAGVFQFGAVRDAGCCYYAMELVEGETLEARVRREGPLEVGTALEIASQVAAALTAAASRGLIHRDLKPGNLMLTTDGSGGAMEVKVIDFGLAKAAAATTGEADLTHGGFVGTPAFASPEQFNRGTVDARSDIYSLGVTLWYVLTGRVPFTGRSVDELCDSPARAELPVDQLRARKVPAPVVDLLRAMLAADPAERPASAHALASALETCRRQLADGSRGGPPVAGERRPTARARLAVLLLSIAVLTTAVVAWRSFPRSVPTLTTQLANSSPALPAIPEKSVAVLPFENLSADKDNAFFADGVQDEVLTDLSKVADLKVISRTSVMQFKDTGSRNLPEIGKALGVAFVVEGSVQRAGNKIRVVAQLIDARTDAHKWAEHYDRDLADVFAIQSEIAQAIAGQLQAAISPQAHAAIEEAPTHDLQAYALYLKAREKWSDASAPDFHAVEEQIVQPLQEATRLDPTFTQALALLTEAEAIIYQNDEATPAREATVRGLVETIARLRPGSFEAHEAEGDYQHFVRHDFIRSREEYAAAVQLAPNSADALAGLAGANCRLGHWEEATDLFRRASEVNPESNEIAAERVYYLMVTGPCQEVLDVIDHALATHPQWWSLHMFKCQALLRWRADTHAVRAELASLSGFDPNGSVTMLRLDCDYFDRDFAAADRDLAACPLAEISIKPRFYYQAYNARYRGDAAAAAAGFAQARMIVEAKVRAEPANADELMILAWIDAFLGRQPEAQEEARRAAAMHPPEQDARRGPELQGYLAQVLALTGEREEAIRILQRFSGKPAGPTYGWLKGDPDWDPLRGDPRFQAIVASLAPSRDR